MVFWGGRRNGDLKLVTVPRGGGETRGGLYTVGMVPAIYTEHK